jgi:hypothetical protein
MQFFWFSCGFRAIAFLAASICSAGGGKRRLLPEPSPMKPLHEIAVAVLRARTAAVVATQKALRNISPPGRCLYAGECALPSKLGFP